MFEFTSAPKTTLSEAASPIVIVPPLKVVVPVTVKLPPTAALPVTVRLSATVVSEVVWPIVTAMPLVSVATFNAPVEFVI